MSVVSDPPHRFAHPPCCDFWL